MFATSGATVQLWDTSRSEALQSFEWGADTVTSVRFNPAQHSLLCCLSADRGVTMYDVNSGSALQKMTMQTRANAACWNPMVCGSRAFGAQRPNCPLACLERSYKAAATAFPRIIVVV
eukprot:scaffold22784_cov34-Tisochrysis_lutea.AAC.7